MMHEQINAPLSNALHAPSFLTPSLDTIPYGIVLAPIVFFYATFLLSLSPRIRKLIIISGTTYILGALGIELIEGNWLGLNGGENLTYALIVTIEEFLEMIGLVGFVYALTTYIATNLKGLRFGVAYHRSE